MKPNFYQVAIIVFLAGLFGYFVWPTLYSYEDIKVRKRSNTSLPGLPGLFASAGDEDIRIRTHRISGTAEEDLGLGRWIPFVRPPECSLSSPVAASDNKSTDGKPGWGRPLVFESLSSQQTNEAVIPCVPIKVEAYDAK
jgi:hypothetical protein